MNVLTFIAAKAPKDLWIIIINWIQGAISNYGWTILLFTLLIKLLMSPLDFLVKLSNKKQTLIQKKCSPQVAKLKKKFGANQEQLRIQTQALYKREGLNMGTGCIIMLVNMIAIWAVFFTLFDSLRKVSAYEVITQYETIEQSYEGEYVRYLSEKVGDPEIDTIEEADAWYVANVEGQESSPNYVDNLKIITDANVSAGKVACKTWNEVKEDWLWVQNIWVADSTTAPLPTYDKLLSIAKDGGYKAYVEQNIDKNEYITIRNAVTESSSRTKNGYFLVPIIVGLLTFLSQVIADLHNKLKNKKAQTLATASGDASMGSTMKMMKIVMPVIMVLFAFSSSTSFGIYLLASSIASIATGEVISLIVNKMTKKQQEEVEAVLEKEANRQIKKGKLQEK